MTPPSVVEQLLAQLPADEAQPDYSSKPWRQTTIERHSGVWEIAVIKHQWVEVPGVCRGVTEGAVATSSSPSLLTALRDCLGQL